MKSSVQISMIEQCVA